MDDSMDLTICVNSKQLSFFEFDCVQKYILLEDRAKVKPDDIAVAQRQQSHTSTKSSSYITQKSKFKATNQEIAPNDGDRPVFSSSTPWTLKREPLDVNETQTQPYLNLSNLTSEEQARLPPVETAKRRRNSSSSQNIGTAVSQPITDPPSPSNSSRNRIVPSTSQCSTQSQGASTSLQFLPFTPLTNPRSFQSKRKRDSQSVDYNLSSTSTTPGTTPEVIGVQSIDADTDEHSAKRRQRASDRALVIALADFVSTHGGTQGNPHVVVDINAFDRSPVEHWSLQQAVEFAKQVDTRLVHRFNDEKVDGSVLQYIDVVDLTDLGVSSLCAKRFMSSLNVYCTKPNDQQ
jgi:hypothetical protein